jgi:hypothetical protein
MGAATAVILPETDGLEPGRGLLQSLPGFEASALLAADSALAVADESHQV